MIEVRRKRSSAEAALVHVLDQMSGWAWVKSRAMFGGFGLARDGCNFAIVVRGTLYLKTDAQTQEKFAAVGSAPFEYVSKNRRVVLNYWRAPEECLEQSEHMRFWCDLAWQAALRARTRSKSAS